jgi:Na+/H+ antiporter NhaC
MNNLRNSTLLRFLIFGFFVLLSFQAFALEPIKKPFIVVADVESSFEIDVNAPSNSFYEVNINGDKQSFLVQNSKVIVPFTINKKTLFSISTIEVSSKITVHPIPKWFSIIPPLLAILFALIFKEVFTALFMGIFIGTTTIWYFYGESFWMSLLKGFFTVISDYIIPALNDPGHLSIIVFSMLIGGMVQIITANGGMKGVVNFLSKFANSKKSGQFITWVMGISIFFDDYANTLVVGNTMRPVADRLRVSREKLAFLVDSTAAPVAAVALITTWVGAELGYIQDGINNLGLSEAPYSIFLHSLQFAFYPFMMLGFILIIIFTGRDFGPMYKAEKRAIEKDVENIALKQENTESDEEGLKTRALNAVIPVLVVVFGTIAGLIITGLKGIDYNNDLSFFRNLSLIIGQSDSYLALLWSSLAGTFVAIILSVSQRILSLKESVKNMVEGLKHMLTAVLILTLAWALAILTENIKTAEFISGSLINLNINPYAIPAITFILSALVAFSTGSSWGTMAILYPLMLPASWLLNEQAGMGYSESMHIFYNVVSVVLAGSVLGDHCSPISDTTIMSSLASQCDHIEHVRTQLPYALSVGLVAILVGTIPSSLGFPVLLSYLLGFSLLLLVVYLFGKKSRNRLNS